LASPIPSSLIHPTATSSGGASGGRGGRAGRTAGRGRGRGGRGAAAAASASTPNADPSANQSFSSIAMNGGSNGTSIVREDVYWMIGYDQLIREERHRATIGIVTDQLEHVAGEITSIILTNSMNQELGANPSKSAPMTLEEIHMKLKEKKLRAGGSSTTSLASLGNGGTNGGGANGHGSSQESSISLETLKKLLDVMRLSSLGTIVRVVGNEETSLTSSSAMHGSGASSPNVPVFVVNFESIISALRRRTIQQIAQSRFGVASGRIIELLTRFKYLEQQTVSDRAILPARETRERLYRLYL
jgi:hypothetical protein